MFTQAKKNKLTGRVEIVKLEADTACDELLLTELFRVMQPDEQGEVVITNVRGNRNKIITWSGEHK